MRLHRDTCRSIRDLLPLHVGGDLDAGPARRVDEHLHHCLSCFREFRDLAALRQRLVALGEQQPPAAGLEHFTEEVMARVALGERGPAAELPGVRRTRPSVMVPLAAAATLMVGVALGYVARTGAAGPGAGPSLAPSRGLYLLPAAPVTRVEGPAPAGVHGFPVGDGLGRAALSPEDSTLIDTIPRRGPEFIRFLLDGGRERLTPEPDRQLRPREPEPAPQDG